ncbi:MAG: replication initiation protein [Bacteroidales bacterium]|nr:replication initiation protein [Bacteroidales bacterium]
MSRTKGSAGAQGGGGAAGKGSGGELVVTNPREVVESYIFTTSRRDLSIYSERLLLRVVEIAQRQVQGLHFRGGQDIGQVSIGTLGEVELEIPIRNLLSPGDTNYTQAKTAIMELMRNPYFVERPKLKNGQPVYDADGVQQFEFFGHQLLNDCKVNVKPGVAQIVVNKTTWEAVLDFSKGFRKFDINAAMMLQKTSSARLFRLVSNQSSPLTYSIEELKQMWGLVGRYKKASDFVRGVIAEAKAELDAKAPWSFEYVTNCNGSAEVNAGRRGRRAITSVTFFPVRKITNMSTGAVIKQLDSPKSTLGQDLYELLLNKFGFTHQGIKNNLMLFATAKKAGLELYDFLYSIAPKALHATNPQGYVVNSVERKLRESFGVEKVPGGYVVPEGQ